MTANPFSDESWALRPYQPGDENLLVQLFEQVFGRSMTPAFWLWKFKQLPSPVQNVWLGVVEDQPIFQYASMPMRYNLHDEANPCMVLVDVMTAGPHRRRGVLSTAGTRIHDLYRRAGIPFVFGLPNEKWQSRLAYFGWQPLFELVWLIFPLNPVNLLARFTGMARFNALQRMGAIWRRWWQRKIPFNGTVEVNEIKAPGDEFNQLWHRCRSDFACSIVRDRRWIDWRFFQVPDSPYRVLIARRAGVPLGYLVYRFDRLLDPTSAVIVDLLTARRDLEVRATLLRSLFDRLFSQGVDNVKALAVPNNWLFDTYRRVGFIRRPHAFRVMAIQLGEKPTTDELRDPDDWAISGADFDVV